MIKKEDDINIDDNFQKESIHPIKFMTKKRKSRTILMVKLISFFTITVAISIVFSLLVFKYKYKMLVNKTIEIKENNSINEEYSNAIDNVKNSLVTIGASKEELAQNSYSSCNTTGIIIEESGRILTNYSMIKDLNEIYVDLSFIGSEPLKAEIIVTNEEADIAILQVDCNDSLIPIKIASRDEIIEGEKILLISNSTADEYIDNLIPGIITSTNRQLEVNDKKYNLFEVNTPINKFNTGGIISNLKGEVIGVASKKITDSMNVDGLYYALDLNSLESIINYTKKIKDILGIVEGEFIKNNSVENYLGLYVARVHQNRDLYKEGLRPTDIIFEIEGKKINNITQVIEVLKNKENGDTVTCRVMKSGEVRDIDIVLSNIDK